MFSRDCAQLAEAAQEARRCVQEGRRAQLQQRRALVGTLVEQRSRPSTFEDLDKSGTTLRVHVDGMKQVLATSPCAEGLFAHYADVIHQVGDPIRGRCSQISLLCDRLPSTGLGDPSEHLTCLAALSACTWFYDHLIRLERECFGGDSLACFETQYLKHFHTVHEDTTDAASRYLSSPSGHPEAYNALRRSLPEVERLRALHGADPCRAPMRCRCTLSSGVGRE